jgi:hypothetical protein
MDNEVDHKKADATRKVSEKAPSALQKRARRQGPTMGELVVLQIPILSLGLWFVVRVFVLFRATCSLS